MKRSRSPATGARRSPPRPSTDAGAATSSALSPARAADPPERATASAAQIAIASRRAFSIPARSSSAAASSSAVAIVASARGSRTGAFLLPCLLDRADELVQIAVEHVRQIVRREVNAVVGDPVLREVVGTYLGRPVARPHHRPALAGPRRFLLGHHAVEEPRAQDLERLDLVLQLRLLVLALHLEPRRA